MWKFEIMVFESKFGGQRGNQLTGKLYDFDKVGGEKLDFLRN